MLERDEVIMLPSGTEIDVASALGDLVRAIADTPDDGIRADLEHVGELVEWLAARVPSQVEPVFTPTPDLADAWRRYQEGDEVTPWELCKLDEQRADWREDVVGS